MKVAVTYENGEVFQHFDIRAFKLYEVEGGEGNHRKLFPRTEAVMELWQDFTGKRRRGSYLRIIGAGAQNALAEAGIKLYGGSFRFCG